VKNSNHNLNCNSVQGVSNCNSVQEKQQLQTSKSRIQFEQTQFNLLLVNDSNKCFNLGNNNPIPVSHKPKPNLSLHSPYYDKVYNEFVVPFCPSSHIVPRQYS